MSHETYAWAKEQRCGSPVTKAVLLEIANWSKPSGLCEFLSVDRISEVIEVDARTVRRHIAKLEDCDLLNGGLGLIRRVQRYADKGGQLPNAFELVGFEPPLSLARAAGQAKAAKPAQSAAKAQTGQGDNMTPPHDNLSPPPCHPCQGEGDSGVTRLGFIYNPLSTPNGVDAPPVDFDDVPVGGTGQVEAAFPDQRNEEPERREPEAPARKLTRLPDDWTAPRLDTLPPKAQSLVRQWPSGAFEAVCEKFRLHWQNEAGAKGRKTNWDAALAMWCIGDHSKIMRDAKAGVSFASLAPAAAGAALGNGGPVSKPRTVFAKAGEGDRAKAMRKWLRTAISPHIYDTWMENTGFVWDGTTLLVLTAGQFQRDWIADRWTEQIASAAAVVLGQRPPVVVEVEQETAKAKNQEDGGHG